MEFFDVIYGRRSIRKYTKEEIPGDVIMKAIDCARHAPSAGNIQPWEFVIVREKEIREKLYRACFSQSHVMEAPLLIVVCVDLMKSAYYGTRGTHLYGIQDTAAAIENMLLAFHAMGYGTCWVGAFSEIMVREIINAPKDIKPVAIITVGKSDEIPQPRSLRKIEDMVHYEKFENQGTNFLNL